MSKTKKIIFLKCSRDELRELQGSLVLKVDASSLDAMPAFDLAYVVDYVVNAHVGVLGEPKRVIIEHGLEGDSRVLTIEFKRLLSDSNLLSDVHRLSKQKIGYVTDDWQVDENISAALSPESSNEHLVVNVSASPHLSIKSAIKSLANTYSVSADKVTISISG